MVNPVFSNAVQISDPNLVTISHCNRIGRVVQCKTYPLKRLSNAPQTGVGNYTDLLGKIRKYNYQEEAE